MESLTGGELAGIVIGSLIAGIILIALLIYGLRIWLRGPTKGSDVNVNLENKVVVITGKAIQNMWGSPLTVFNFYTDRNQYLSVTYYSFCRF